MPHPSPRLAPSLQFYRPRFRLNNHTQCRPRSPKRQFKREESARSPRTRLRPWASSKPRLPRRTYVTTCSMCSIQWGTVVSYQFCDLVARPRSVSAHVAESPLQHMTPPRSLSLCATSVGCVGDELSMLYLPSGFEEAHHSYRFRIQLNP